MSCNFPQTFKMFVLKLPLLSNNRTYWHYVIIHILDITPLTDITTTHTKSRVLHELRENVCILVSSELRIMQTLLITSGTCQTHNKINYSNHHTYINNAFVWEWSILQIQMLCFNNPSDRVMAAVARRFTDLNVFNYLYIGVH